MSLVINNNQMASNVARNLNSHYSRLSTSTQRLSSGLRVNSAADDAAGLAIRELMRTDVAALNQGARNANDAISLIQVADGALSIIDEKLIRMKELAEQAATGTYDSTQRLMIDSEFQAMAAEIDRIANATDFNGIHLLDGSLKGEHDGSGLNSTGKMKIHFGSANDSAEDYYYIEIGDCTTNGLGLTRETETSHILTSSSTYSKLPAGLQWINDATIDYENNKILLDIPNGIGGTGAYTFIGSIDYFQLPAGLENVVITSNSSIDGPFFKPHSSIFLSDGTQLTGVPNRLGTWHPLTLPNYYDGGVANSNWWYEIPPEDIISTGIEKNVFDGNAKYDGSYKMDIRQPGNSITVNGMTITSVTGINELGTTWNLHTAGVTNDEVFTIDNVTENIALFINGGHETAYINDTNNLYTLRIEADMDDDFLEMLNTYVDPDMEIISIKTQDKAQEALVTINDAIVIKDKIRAHLGALQNRFENTVTNLTIQAENLQAAESRISDVDVATEMTQFVRNQILTQSAVSMLSQANSMPQMAMQLING